MPEVMKIQEPTQKVGETASLPDENPYREYGQKDNWYSLMAQMFHTPSVLNSLPDAWCLIMKANRAHLVIMLREAGAGHDPFGNAEWSSTPTQVWEKLAQVQQLPTLDGADLSGVDFKWADLGLTKLSNVDLTGAGPQMGQPDGHQPVQHQPDRGRPQMGRHGRGRPDRGQPALHVFGRRHQAGRSYRAGTLAQEKPDRRRTHQERGATGETPPGPPAYPARTGGNIMHARPARRAREPRP